MKRFFIWMLAFTMPLTFISCEQGNNPSQSNNDVGEEMIVQLGILNCVGDQTYPIYYLLFTDSYMINGTDADYYKFVDFGPVNKLSQIDYIPDGWREDRIDISVGHGYIVQRVECPNTFLRLYIKEFIDKGGVQGYRIVYQKGWNPLNN